ncbi:MAG: InlB B-repeat-containing protein [Candidatus Methanomethylophilus sp.]|nr:InlB B-repeat-containing protein [Methanomethylophilus sp.]
MNNWTTAWDSEATDSLGANIAVWNYNAEKGWYLGGAFGSSTDTVYAISHENYYKANGPTAIAAGVFGDKEGNWYAPAGWNTDNCKWGYVQAAPRDLKAAPAEVVFGADPAAVKEYTLILDNKIEGEDMTLNGTYTVKADSPVNALFKVLTDKGVAHKLKYGAASVYFGDKSISDWSFAWNSSNDLVGANYAVWNYNAEKGWYLGNSFGMDADTTYYLSHENYYCPDGKTARSMGVDAFCAWDNPAAHGLVYDGKTGGYLDIFDAAATWYHESFGMGDAAKYGITYDGKTGGYDDVSDALTGWMASFDNEYKAGAGICLDGTQYGYFQLCPRDLKAAPADMIYGPDLSTMKEYTFIINNSVEGEDSSFNGLYTVTAANPVQAFITILDKCGVANKLDWNAASVYPGSGDIANWTTAWDKEAADVVGANFAIWNYNSEKGWFTGNSLGKDPETTYLISHEIYYKATGPTAVAAGVFGDKDGNWYAPAGWNTDNCKWGYVQAAPRDLKAAPADVVFGADPAALKEYTFIINNSIDGEDSSFNGTFTAKGANPVQAFKALLTEKGVASTFDYYSESVYFKSKMISDWTTAWDAQAEDALGANIAIWNYNAEKGWFMGNSFGKDPETVYLISHEMYYKASGPTAIAAGVFGDKEGNWYAPAGWNTDNCKWGYVQAAPRDLKAAPAEVVFGADPAAIQEYTLILLNLVEGQDNSINTTYTGVGTNPVQALVYALDRAGVANTLDYGAESIYFGNGMISDWTTAWDSASADVIGANYSIWNYNTEKGWFTGNSFGKDPETVYLIVHENYYQPKGQSSVAIGVVDNGDGTYTAPAGVEANAWYAHLTPVDLKAAPADVEVRPFYFITFDSLGGSAVPMQAYHEGANIVAPANPTKTDVTFNGWSPALPTTMGNKSITVTAVWLVKPVEKEDTVEVDLSGDDDNFIMPETTKTVTVEMANNSSVVIKDTSELAGKVVTASITSVENPSTVKGTAYEFEFKADGSTYNGKIQVTVPYTKNGEGSPVVYFVNGSENVKMKIISSTDNSVTFETDHNSTYVVATEDLGGEIGMVNMIAAFALAIGIIIAALMAILQRPKKA